MGFTLIELALVTLIIGLLATIVGPNLQRAREKAMVAAIKADMRQMMDGAEAYFLLNNSWPTTVQAMTDGGIYVKNPDIEHCLFMSVPGGGGREPYFLLLSTHPGASTVMFTVYPLWNGQMIEWDSGGFGC